MPRTRGLCIVALWLSVVAAVAAAECSADTLEEGFRNPPDVARPRVWWHWMNGSVTEEGIKLDLEWMRRVGIGGFQQFDADLRTPVALSNRIPYMSPDWWRTYGYALKVADELGLQATVSMTPGSSEAGGPWVTPSQAMKKLVWSEVEVDGGKPLSKPLPLPPRVTGPFQDIQITDVLANVRGEAPRELPDYYADSAVIAYRVSPSENARLPRPSVTWSRGGDGNSVALPDGETCVAVNLPKTNSPAWVRFEFKQTQTVQAVTVRLEDPSADWNNWTWGGAQRPIAVVESSDDGSHYQRAAFIPGDGAVQHTVSFPAAHGRVFRVRMLTAKRSSDARQDYAETDFGNVGPQETPEYRISKLILHATSRVDRFEEKAGFGLADNLAASPSVRKSESMQSVRMLDLTGRMEPDGTLKWNVPKGHWLIWRFGYSLTGSMNSPAAPEGTGLEVDKLSRRHVQAYLSVYLEAFKQHLRDFGNGTSTGIRYGLNDSWEAGTANWTEDLIPEFGRRRGYDIKPWLPVLTGRIVDSAKASDRFLWDFRKTLGELLIENYFDQMTEALHAYGLGRYGESHENGRAFVGDGMEAKRSADVPMGAMWVQKEDIGREDPNYMSDLRESASVAHIYGRKEVAAESFTTASGPFSWSPATLKPTADLELAMGVNQFAIHTSPQQPYADRKPGLSLGPFGQWFTRNETWADQAGPWINYLGRSSYLLQQGTYVADIAYFYGEDSNLTSLYHERLPGIPEGHSFDYVNADALTHQFDVVNGLIGSRSGVRYHLLAIDPSAKSISVPVLRAIHDLVGAGVVLVGAKPRDTPSLADNDREFHRLAERLWGADGRGGTVGRGRVYGTEHIAKVLQSLSIEPDFSYEKARCACRILFVHRHLSNGELYYLNSRSTYSAVFAGDFRVAGYEPELWHADTGQIEPASYQISGRRTKVALNLEPRGSVFVVFRRPAEARARSRATPNEIEVSRVEGPWEITYPDGSGAPAHARFKALAPWNTNSDPGIRYFSGTAAYQTEIDAPGRWFERRAHLWIDLGDVRDLAEVRVNGVSIGILWKAPYRAEVTQALKPGANILEIRVTNAWVNRLIGDHQRTNDHLHTSTSPQFYSENSPLVPSGLLGPVRIRRSVEN